jgi:hypothetical protein
MDQLLTVSAVARALCRSQEGVRYLADRGKLPCRRTTTGQRLFALRDIEAFIGSGQNGSRPTQPDERNDSD